MPWFGFVVLSMLFSVVTGLLTRILAVKSDDPRAFSFAYNIIAALIALVIFLPQIGNLNVHLTHSVILLIFISTFLYGVFERSQFYARKYIEASTFAILFRSSVFITFITSILFLGESFTIKKILGATLIITANILLAYKKGALKFEAAWIYVIIPALSLGLVRTVDKKITSSFPAEIYNVIVWIFPLVYIFLPSISMRSIKKEINQGSWKIFLTAFANVLTFYFLLKAFSLYEASRIVLITSTESIFLVLSGVILLKERSQLPQKIIAALIAFVGILLIK